jgi:hypothetical protein
MKEKFNLLVKALEKAKVPCEVVLNEFGSKTKVIIQLGWNYPDKLSNKAWDAVKVAGLAQNEFSICAESHGGQNLQSRFVSGGPKRYR